MQRQLGIRRKKWEDGSLQLPLIESPRDEETAVARAKAFVARQERIYSGGLAAYTTAFVIDGASHFWFGQGAPTMSRYDVYGWCFFAYAIVQTTGLMCMAVANVDVDQHMRHRPILAVLAALAIVIYAGLGALQQGTLVGTDLEHLVSDAIFTCIRLDANPQQTCRSPTRQYGCLQSP